MKNSRKNSQKKIRENKITKKITQNHMEKSRKIRENKADQKICGHCDLTEKQLFKTCTTFILT